MLGHKLSDDEVVSKVLRILDPKFDYVVVDIEESKDITKLSLDELNGSLQAYEVMINWGAERLSESALHVRGESSGVKDFDKGAFKG